MILFAVAYVLSTVIGSVSVAGTAVAAVAIISD